MLKRRSSIHALVLMVGTALAVCFAAYGRDAAGLDTAGIIRAIGKKGEIFGDTYKVSFPRSDLRVRAGDVAIKPALALVSWASFKKSGDSAMIFGDLALLEDELNAVIGKLEEKGVEISAIHNHLLHETPRVLYVHFMGSGDESELAKGLREALALTKTPIEDKPASREERPEVAARIEKIIGRPGAMSGGVLHVVVPRDDIHVRMMGVDVPGNMGMSIPLNFQIEGDKAAVNGDFILLAKEVNPVAKALRSAGIEIASLHNHMLDEEPRLFFMHFWAYGDAVALAKGLKTALDQTGK